MKYIKYILILLMIILIFIVGLTIGADNDQVITFNYIIAKSEMNLSILLTILFGSGFLLGWLLTGILYLKLKFKYNLAVRQNLKQTEQINKLTHNVDYK